MFSEFLTQILTRSNLSGGCGMSTRPEFYSGRGATSSDLSSAKLTTLYNAIVAAKGRTAGKAFTKMVAAIPKLSATDFLIALAMLERSGWVYKPAIVGLSNGVYASDGASAYATVAAVLGGSSCRDDTVLIRSAFLRAHGIKDPLRKPPMNGNLDYDGEYPWGEYPWE